MNEHDSSILEHFFHDLFYDHHQKSTRPNCSHYADFIGFSFGKLLFWLHSWFIQCIWVVTTKMDKLEKNSPLEVPYEADHGDEIEIITKTRKK